MRGELIRRIWHSNPELYAPARFRRACEYEVFVPFPLVQTDTPPIEAELSGVISDAESRVLALNTKALPALAPLARFLLRTESIASSKVEGMQVDAESLARAEVRRDLGARVGRDALEILANIDAMQLAIEEASSAEALQIENILSVHRLLMQETRPQIAGQLRDTQNWIGGNDYNPCDADFVPPPSGQVEGLMSDLLDFCNDDSLAPLVQAAIAHAQFETIHPFDDGNGRTGRALVQILLRRRGLAPSYVPPISVILASDKDRYIRGLTDFREGRDHEWLEIFAVATARAADLADGYLTRVSNLQEQWRKQLSAIHSPRSDAATWSVIDVLPGYPVVTVAVAATATGRSRPAVEQAIKKLTEAEVLQPVSESQRNRAWEVAELLDLLTEIEAL